MLYFKTVALKQEHLGQIANSAFSNWISEHSERDLLTQFQFARNKETCEGIVGIVGYEGKLLNFITFQSIGMMDGAFLDGDDTVGKTKLDPGKFVELQAAGSLIVIARMKEDEIKRLCKVY